MRQFWRLTALPGARSYKATESEGLDDGCHALRMTIPDTYRNLSTVEGVRGESNPHFRLHKPTCRNLYTTNTRWILGPGLEPEIPR